MKGRQIVLGKIAGRLAAALMIDGRLDDLLIAPPDDAPFAPGTILRAIADRPLKGQGGMMMRLPDGDSALLRGARGLSPGTALLVQVTSYAECDKAVPVTDRLVFKGRTIIVTPGAKGLNISRRIKDEDIRERMLEALHMAGAGDCEHGVIIRSNAATRDVDDIAGEAEALLDLTDRVMGDGGTDPEVLLDAPDPHDLALRDWVQTAADDIVDAGFEQTGVLDALADLARPQVSLGAGHMYVEPTHALIAVDVNTGGDFSPASGLKANLACARALPRALRLRGLGGQITIDAAPMPKKDRLQFEQALRAAFKADPVETALVGWTPLGHFELQRKRERLPLPPGILP